MSRDYRDFFQSRTISNICMLDSTQILARASMRENITTVCDAHTNTNVSSENEMAKSNTVHKTKGQISIIKKNEIHHILYLHHTSYCFYFKSKNEHNGYNYG